MKKFYRGKIVKINEGALQFIKNREAGKSFILLTSRNGDVYLPLSAIETCLEDVWNCDEQDRQVRMAHG